MATAKKLPSGNYRCRIYAGEEDGKKIYKSFTAATKKEAEFMATQYLMEYEENKKKSKNELSFKEALKQYISIKEPVLSPSTIRGYRSLERSFEKKFPRFLKTKVCDITQDDIQNVISKLSSEVSPKTVRNYHALISSVIGREMVLKTTMPQKIIPDYHIPTDKEIQNLIKIIEGTELEVPILLGAFGMMRRGEICALSIDDIDFNSNTIHVRHSMVKGNDNKWHIKAPKNNSSDRYVHVPKFIIDKIKSKGYVTTYKPNSLSNTFMLAMEKHGIKHFRFHDLRHYSASIRHALNIPDAYIMSEGGWKTDTVLKSVYRHALKDKANDMTNIAISHFNNLYDTKYDTKQKSPVNKPFLSIFVWVQVPSPA